MKVYISRDALSLGIYTIDAEIFEDEETIRIFQNGNYRLIFTPYWSYNLKDAMKNAIAIKNYAINDLKLQIKQLKKYEIKVFDAYEQVQAKDK